MLPVGGSRLEVSSSLPCRPLEEALRSFAEGMMVVHSLPAGKSHSSIPCRYFRGQRCLVAYPPRSVVGMHERLA